jgi:flagellar biosynthesis protein FlhG
MSRVTRKRTRWADQADGLRRLFAASQRRFVPLVANPHVVWSGVVIEQLAEHFAVMGGHPVVVDAADTSPAPPEAAALGLAGCITQAQPGWSYLAARGLLRRYMDTRGSAAALLEALAEAAPASEVFIVHGEPTDLARIFRDRAARPLLLAADQPESLKHAYAGWKLLSQRCGWMSADLLLAGCQSLRGETIARSLSGTADRFMGATLAHWSVVDPAGEADPFAAQAMTELIQAQLALEPTPQPHAEATPHDAADGWRDFGGHGPLPSEPTESFQPMPDQDPVVRTSAALAAAYGL